MFLSKGQVLNGATYECVDSRSLVLSRFDFEKMVICCPSGRPRLMWICILPPKTTSPLGEGGGLSVSVRS